jgi:glucose/arabinose dehydrogenase
MGHMRSAVFAATLMLAACTGSPSSGQQGGASVAQGAPNSDFTPAFAGQTRAPEARSGVAIDAHVVASGLNHPWAIAFLPDGRLLVTERAGRLRVITREGDISEPVAGLPEVFAQGQGGLLDVALGPTFASDRLIYWSYAEQRQGGNGTTVARGRLSTDASRIENVQVIFRQTPAWQSRGHFGSRLVFDREGRLYITLGDRQGADSRPFAQDASTHIGKVVRINPDGSVPADNPYVGQANARGENWSIGHRNIQGADLHPETGALWIVEHGPRGGDEINIPQAGRNYGWPVIGYGINYNGQAMHQASAREGMEQPIYYWDPVIAPGDMDFYRGELFAWGGDILIAGLDTEALVRLDVEGERVTGEERFALGVGRLRDVAESEDGSLWVVTDENNGRLVRLTPRR